MNRKSLILIFLGVVGLVVVGALIFKSKSSVSSSIPTPVSPNLPQDNQISLTGEPTSVNPDWETYTNNKYGYSIKYPPGWSTIINVISEASNQEILATATSLDVYNGAASKGYPDGVMTIQQLSAIPTLPSSWKKSDIILNGAKFQKFEGENNGLNTETYMIPLASGVIKIDVRYPTGDTIQQTFTAMLSTFTSN